MIPPYRSFVLRCRLVFWKTRCSMSERFADVHRMRDRSHVRPVTKEPMWCFLRIGINADPARLRRCLDSGTCTRSEHARRGSIERKRNRAFSTSVASSLAAVGYGSSKAHTGTHNRILIVQPSQASS